MVAGEGPQPALGMIVGEAPGREEEKKGRPFVGRSGRLLDTALSALGVDRSTVYVTNVVKVIPLDDEDKIRRPSMGEVSEWYDILQREIQNTAPRAILALGQTASGVLTGIPGDMIPFGSKVGNIYTAWHPSYVMRRGGRLLYPSPTNDYSVWLSQIEPWAEEIQ